MSKSNLAKKNIVEVSTQGSSPISSQVRAKKAAPKSTKANISASALIQAPSHGSAQSLPSSSATAKVKNTSGKVSRSKASANKIKSNSKRAPQKKPSHNGLMLKFSLAGIANSIQSKNYWNKILLAYKDAYKTGVAELNAIKKPLNAKYHKLISQIDEIINKNIAK